MQVSQFLLVLLLSVFFWTVCAAAGEHEHEDEEVQRREGRQLHGQSRIKDPMQLVTDPDTSRFMSVMLVGQVIFSDTTCELETRWKSHILDRRLPYHRTVLPS